MFTINWRPFFFTSSICMIVTSVCLLIVHFALMIPLFIYQVYNYAVYNLFLTLLDAFFITIGTISLILTITTNETTTFKFKRLLLIFLVSTIFFGFTISYPIILFLQWTSHFAISRIIEQFVGPTLAFISPSFSLAFWFIVQIVGWFSTISSFFYLKQYENDLWLYVKGTGTINKFKILTEGQQPQQQQHSEMYHTGSGGASGAVSGSAEVVNLSSLQHNQAASSMV
ncbi:hypothetical protein ABK040_007291 [Willaertia magna]